MHDENIPLSYTQGSQNSSEQEKVAFTQGKNNLNTSDLSALIVDNAKRIRSIERDVKKIKRVYFFQIYWKIGSILLTALLFFSTAYIAYRFINQKIEEISSQFSVGDLFSKKDGNTDSSTSNNPSKLEKLLEDVDSESLNKFLDSF